MRCVSFINNIKFELPGDIYKDAIALGDVDNDMRNELVVGNLAGTLAIFKGNQTRPWITATDLGMISCVVIGDIVNQRRNFITTIGTEGNLFIFDVSTQIKKFDEEKLLFNYSKLGVSCEEATETFRQQSKLNLEPINIKNFHYQKLQANTKTALLADIDNDGLIELIVCLTDRVIRTYRFIKLNDNKGKLVGIHKWEFADQIGTISLNSIDNEAKVAIVVSQPGGTYAKLECWCKNQRTKRKSVIKINDQQQSNNDNVQLTQVADTNKRLSAQVNDDDERKNDDENSETVERISKLTPVYFELDSMKMRNRNISTEIVGGIFAKYSRKPLIALATIDGTLMLVDENIILWSLQVDHQVFSLAKLDVVGPDSEELVACAWDGQTYIVSEDRGTVRFQFSEPVSAFTAGHYTIEIEGEYRTVPCLVYATFSNVIYLYYDINLNSIKANNLIDILHDSSEYGQLKEKLDTLGINKNIESIIEFSLYKFNSVFDENGIDEKESENKNI